MDEEFAKVLKQVQALPQPDRATNLTLMFLGEALNLLLRSGDQKRIIEFKKNIDALFTECSKAIVNASANSN